MMRQSNYLATLLILALTLFTASCGGNDDNELIVSTPEAITLSISGGESVTVDGKDITKEVTITASAVSDQNILVMLTPENALEGEVTFASNHLLIVAGETTASTLVAFTTKGFPAGAIEKNIGITISTATPHVAVGSDQTTTFAVKGVGGREMVKLAVTSPSGLSFDTTNDDGVAKILFTLDAALDFDLPVTIQYADGCDIDVQGASTWSPFPMSVPKGQLSAVQTITVGRGITGVMKLKINLEPGDNVKLDQEKVDFTFLKYEASITAKDGTNVRVPKSNSVKRTFVVALTNPAIKPVNVALELTGDPIGGASMSVGNAIQFAVGEQSKEISVTFSNQVFNSKDVSESISIALASSDVPVTSGKGTIVYQVAGEKAESEKEPLALEFKTEGTGDSPRDVHRMDLPYNNNGDGQPPTRYDFWIAAKQAVEQTQNILLDVELQGFEPEDYYCSDINSEGNYTLKPHKDSNTGNVTLDNWLFTIRFTPSAKGKEGKIIFRSNDATISSGEIIVTVK